MTAHRLHQPFAELHAAQARLAAGARTVGTRRRAAPAIDQSKAALLVAALSGGGSSNTAMVELLGSHSNPSLLSRIRKLRAGQSVERVSDRPAPPRQRQVRLGPEVVTECGGRDDQRTRGTVSDQPYHRDRPSAAGGHRDSLQPAGGPSGRSQAPLRPGLVTGQTRRPLRRHRQHRAQRLQAGRSRHPAGRDESVVTQRARSSNTRPFQQPLDSTPFETTVHEKGGIPWNQSSNPSVGPTRSRPGEAIAGR